ncbi:MAG: UDP-N-acetylmuramoyl-L-alanyl-D-glutamate--2,6-diaminopimelate ligase [bacterium]|nr:UDP-N-acetylmuramoyl-L-alanyl-D-glutamate--2,6-diaminopimelate ligase [bacterium]
MITSEYFLAQLSGVVDTSNLGQLIQINAVTADSRQVVPGSVFVAQKGHKDAGSKFIADAVARGASLLIISADIPLAGLQLPTVRVGNTRLALAEISRMFSPAGLPDLIGVTGTNGKTSCSWIIAHALAEIHGVSAYSGTLGTALVRRGEQVTLADSGNTTPCITVTRKFLGSVFQSGGRVAACEVSSHGIDQYRAYGLPWKVGILTNITRDHLDYHGTFANYRDTKLLYFQRELQQTGAGIVLPAGDAVAQPLSVQLVKSDSLRDNLWFFGHRRDFSKQLKGHCLMINSVRNDNDGMQLNLEVEGKTISLISKLRGDYNALNIAASLAGLLASAIDLPEALHAVSTSPPVPGRLEHLLGPGFSVYIDYAHTPDALLRAQQSVREITSGRLITVFGCGGNRDRGKRPLMGDVVSRNSDIFFVTSDNPRDEKPDDIIEDIIAGITTNQAKKYVIADRGRAIAEAISVAQAGDAVLIAGKGHEDYQEIAGEKYHFADREVALSCIQALTGNVG